MKYGTWAVSGPKNKADVERLRRAGYSPITAAVLCSRGYDTPELAREFGVCKSTVCRTIQRAERRLRRCLRY